MSDEDHEALGAMLHRGNVEAGTRGRDYHNELAAENERLRERVEFLERRLTSEENVAEKCGAAADTLRAELAAAKERVTKYQSLSAELSDKLNGTPCAEIRWQEERDALRAELAAAWDRASDYAQAMHEALDAADERDALRELLRETRPFALMFAHSDFIARIDALLKGGGNE